MYKDREKQKEANRLAAQKRRDKVKGMTLDAEKVHETSYPDVIPEPYNGPDIRKAGVDPYQTIPGYGTLSCQCQHCKQNKGKYILNHGPIKHNLGPMEVNRVALPGDPDYERMKL
jgi:hypothetical protein